MSLPRCRRCHRVLKDPESINIGFGRTRFEKIRGKDLSKSMIEPHSRSRVKVVKKRKINKDNMSIFDLIDENLIEGVESGEKNAK